MNLKLIKTLLPPQDGAAKILAACWSHNNRKLAICTADRVILLFDENFERRDKFSTKPVDPKYGKRSYVVRGMAFSPDSTRLAVGQSDQIIYVYRVGDNWGEKKVISNKFYLGEPLTCLIWPPDGPLIHGLMDGKVRAAYIKSNKSVVLLSHDSCVVSLAYSCTGKGLISGHADGSIIRFLMDDDTIGELQGKIVTHSCPPNVLVWTFQSIMAAGSDLRVVVYSHDGSTLQVFDYTEDLNEREFTVGLCNATGYTTVVASFDRLRIYNWDPEMQMFQESNPKEVQNWYSVTCLAWKRDGSKLIVGTLCGSVDVFDCHTKRSVYHNKFEVRYVGPKQVIVRDLESPTVIELKSKYGYDIMNIKISSKDTHIIAYTVHTLILIQIEDNLTSEIPWHGIGGQEKFSFDTEGVCLIFNSGELSIVEYGQNAILGSVRTDFTNPHLISVRVNDRFLDDDIENKKLAYLIDLKTICVLDLLNGETIQQTSHRSKIDWLELNESAKKLLFRDRKQRLTLLNVETGEKTTMLTYCTFVQWVPLSDVVVAQNRNSICVWYNIDFTDRVTQIPVQGEVVDLVRGGGKTEVIVNDGIDQITISLDDVRIEFVNSLHAGDYSSALTYVEDLELTESSEAMWATLSQISLEKKLLPLAERCFAGIMDASKAKFLQETIAIAEEMPHDSEKDMYEHYAVKARLALLSKDLKEAEAIYLEKDKVKEAIQMYQKAHKWKEAIRTAENKNDAGVEDLKRSYFQWLSDTGQDEKAGELKEMEGDYYAAIDLYLKAGLPARAAKLVSSLPPGAADNDKLVQTIASSLMKGEFYEHAGDLYEKMNNYHKALECYRLGNAFGRAVELARTAFPEEVIHLEEEWGDHLVSIKQPDAAANHFLESGAYIKALDAAISSRQWKKAAQIIEIIDNPTKVLPYYPKLANHYLSVGEYELAEHFFVEGGMHKDAMDMYITTGDWEKAHKLAGQFLPPDEVTRMYINQAEILEQEGKLKDAEKLYISVGEPDRAVSMYRSHKQYENMMRVIEKFNPERLQDAHILLAKELEGEGNFKLAEHYYLTGEEWKSAVNMYRNLDMWEDAYEVAKTYGTAIAAKQIAYLWAKNLGGESAIKLLTKFGLLESAIDYAAENCAFEFAFELASSSMESKLPDIHLKYAMFLEDEGKYQEAEIEFIKAGRPKEAVLMYVHQQNWESAQRVAEAYDKDSVSEVLVGQARFAFEKGEFQKAESLLLRAQRGELAIKFYKDAKMWTDALRVCKDYLPSKFAELQEEYEAEICSTGNKDPEQLLIHGQEWEEAGQFSKAVECYMQASETNSANYDALEKCWTKAVELSWRFMGRQQTEELANQVAPKLVSIKRYTMAAHVLLKVNMVRKAVDALIYGEEWSKAKRVAKEYDSRLEEYVDQRYKDSLQAQGKTELLADVDVIAALDIYAEQQNWKKCLEVAEKQGSKVLHKYVALCSADLIREGRVDKAIKLYVDYGTPAYEQNYNLYQHIGSAVLDSRDLNCSEAYKTWANLRDMIFDLVKNIEKGGDSRGKDTFEQLLLISHYYSIRSACLGQSSLDKHAAKLSISLLRHIALIPADKAFYEAGLAARDIGWESMAFVFWNHYLDICEAIEDGDPGRVDNTGFTNTDIPLEFPLPEKMHLSSRDHEMVREWILSVSVDQRIEPVLPLDERMTYEASLTSNGEWFPPCIITGYPVIRNKLEFKDTSRNRVANKDDWNKFLMAAKVSHSPECQDVLKFITMWCGGASNLSYSFQ